MHLELACILLLFAAFFLTVAWLDSLIRSVNSRDGCTFIILHGEGISRLAEIDAFFCRRVSVALVTALVRSEKIYMCSVSVVCWSLFVTCHWCLSGGGRVVWRWASCSMIIWTGELVSPLSHYVLEGWCPQV